MKNTVVFIIALAFGAAALSRRDAFANTPEEVQDEDLATSVWETNAECGLQLEASIDWNSFANSRWRERPGAPAAFCEAPLSSLRRLCATGAGRKAFGKIKRVLCRYGGEGKQSLSFASGSLIWSVDWLEVNGEPSIDEWLNDYFHIELSED